MQCGSGSSASCLLLGRGRGSSMHAHANKPWARVRPISTSLVPHAVLGIGDLPKQSTPLPVSTQHLSAATSAAQQATETHGVQQTTAHIQPAYTVPPVDRWWEDPVLMSGCEAHAAPLQVAVLLSGGVDSSLALRLLVAAGHSCKAFYLQIWFQEDFRNFWDACPWEEDLKYAQQVCDSLGVPLEVVPMTNQYWEKVVSHSVEEIRAGRTPNPDMLCNSRVKFGAFLDHLDAVEASGGPRFDRVASGHYARVLRHYKDTPTAGSSLNGGAVQGSNTVSCTSVNASPAHATFSVPALPKQASPAQADTEAGPAHDTTVIATTQLTLATPAQATTATGPASATATSATVAAAAATVMAAAASADAPRPEVAHEDIQEAEALLVLTPDPIKDQTYFLAHLTPRQLSRTMFPLGGLTKPQVRALAAAAGLATQARKDSQGICFLGKVKFPEFVKEHLGEWQGLIVEHEQWQQLQQQPNTQQPSLATTFNKLQSISSSQLQSQHLSVATSSTQLSMKSSNGSGGGSRQGIAGSSGKGSGQRKRGSSREGSWEGNREGSRGGNRDSSGEGSSKSGEGKVNKGGVAPTLALFGGHRVLGVHQGYWFYTVGQRGGIKLPGGPWYVTKKDCDLNIVYVSKSYHEPGRKRNAFITGTFSWLSARRPNPAPGAAPLLCKVRHGPHAYQCELRPLPHHEPASVSHTLMQPDVQPALPSAPPALSDASDASGISINQAGHSVSQGMLQQGSQVSHCESSFNGLHAANAAAWDQGAVVVLDGSDQGLAAGQYAVFYQDGVCLGTAKIEGCVDVEQGYAGPRAQGAAGVLSGLGLQFQEQ